MAVVAGDRANEEREKAAKAAQTFESAAPPAFHSSRVIAKAIYPGTESEAECVPTTAERPASGRLGCASELIADASDHG